MPDATPNLGLPYIQSSQAQKHITHNEALQKLDALVQLIVADQLDAPPVSANEGDCFAIGVGAVEAWFGKDLSLAFYQNGQWMFLAPKSGWTAWFLADSAIKTWSGTAWEKQNSFPALGINATPDMANRLAIASPASLFSHEGGGHQLKINKAGAGETASILLQDHWSGRAEIGLAGNDNLSIKVSPDGQNWATAMEVRSNAVVSFPGKPAVRASYDEGDFTRLNGHMTGFSQLFVNQGGFTLGQTPPTGGLGSALIVPVTGVYRICLTLAVTSSTATTTYFVINSVATPVVARSASTAGGSATSLMHLDAGDMIWLTHVGSTTYKFGSGKTELIMEMI